MSDKRCALNVFYTSTDYPDIFGALLRDPDTGTAAFMTNNFTCLQKPSHRLLKKRWQVDCFSNGSTKTCASKHFYGTLRMR